MTNRKPNLPPEAYFPGGGGGSPHFKTIAVFALAALLELSMLVLLASTYTETMGLASNQYLCDLSGAGGLFCIIDEDMTVSHLLAFLLAVFSVAVPIMIWSAVLDERIHEDPRGWLASPINRVKAGMAGLVYGAVVALEVVNLYTLIAQQKAPNPFGTAHDASPMMDFLAQNQGLGVFVALLIALVNTVLALLTVRASRSLMQKGLPMFARYLTSTVLAGFLVLQSASPAHAWDNEEEAPTFFVVIENGGVITDPEGQMDTARQMLGELTEPRRRRATKGSTIHIITSANPTEITWSGTPEQLFEQGAHVLEAIQFRPTCSDLTLSWQEVRNNVRITRPDDLRLVQIGPFIHAGYPCDEGDGLITLPQAVPAEVQLGSLATEASLLRLLNVHADQDEMALEHLEAAGALERAAVGALDFDLMDAARTRSNLGSILGRD